MLHLLMHSLPKEEVEEDDVQAVVMGLSAGWKRRRPSTEEELSYPVEDFRALRADGDQPPMSG